MKFAVMPRMSTKGKSTIEAAARPVERTAALLTKALSEDEIAQHSGAR